MILFIAVLEMGEYGAFVWPAYGVSVLGLIALGVLSFRKMKALEKQIKTLQSKARK